MDQNEVDALVAGLELPDMPGARLLDRVFQHTPSTHRFLVVDPEQPMRTGTPASMAHFLIRPPLTMEGVQAALRRADRVAEWFGKGFAVQVLSRLRKIPSAPLPYYRALSVLDSVDAGMAQLEASVSRFPETAARMVELARSDAFQLPPETCSTQEVLRLLGLEASASLLLVAHLFCQFDRISPYLFSVEAMCDHALRTGRLARALARTERLPEDVQEKAFLAGLLHDAGKLLLAANATDSYARINAEVRFGYRSFTDVEREALGISHAEVGAWLASIWDLPMDVVAALAFHHDARWLAAERFGIPHLVHAANTLSHQILQDLPGGQVPHFDEALLLHHGLAAKIESWTALAGQLFASSQHTDWFTHPLAA